MALVFMDSFDHYATDDIDKKWDSLPYITANGTITIGNSVTRRSGTKYLITYARYAVKDVVDRVTNSDVYTFVFGVALMLVPVYFEVDEGTGRIDFQNSEGSSQISIRISSDGRVRIYKGNTLIEETGPDYFNELTWNHIEVKCYIHDSVGYYEVRLNEVTVLSGSGIDTHTYSGGVSRIRVGGGFPNGSYSRWDDLFFLDGNASDDPVNPMNDFLGDCRVDCIYPNAAGTYTDFTPSAGSNYQNVDDGNVAGGGNIDNDTTYNESNQPGDKDTYNHDSVLALSTSIFAIAQNSCVRKTDAGKRYITQLVRVNGTNYYRDTGCTLNDGEYHLTDNYKVTQRPMDTNPDTDLAWTESDLNSVESGIEITT